jgi:ribosomal RNA-processing protein 9
MAPKTNAKRKRDAPRASRTPRAEAPGSSGSGRGGARAGGRRTGATTRRARQALDDEIASGSSDEEADPAIDEEEGESEEETETAEERRVRMAKEMLAAMDAAARERGGDEAAISDAVAGNLEQAALQRAGKWHEKLAGGLAGSSVPTGGVRLLRGPRMCPTSVAVSPDEATVYCGCKGGAIFSWDVSSGARSLITETSAGRPDVAHREPEPRALSPPHS